MNTTEEDNRKAHELIAEYANFDDMGRLRSAIASALAAEREKAAKIADRFQRPNETMPTLRAQHFTAIGIAEAIRAGDKE